MADDIEIGAASPRGTKRKAAEADLSAEAPRRIKVADSLTVEIYG